MSANLNNAHLNLAATKQEVRGKAVRAVEIATSIADELDELANIGAAIYAVVTDARDEPDDTLEDWENLNGVMGDYGRALGEAARRVLTGDGSTDKLWRSIRRLEECFHAVDVYTAAPIAHKLPPEMLAMKAAVDGLFSGGVK